MYRDDDEAARIAAIVANALFVAFAGEARPDP